MSLMRQAFNNIYVCTRYEDVYRVYETRAFSLCQN